MNRLPLLSTIESFFGIRTLAITAVLLGGFMLVFYVQLLKGSVARGTQHRYSQSAAADAGGARIGLAGPGR